MRRLAVFGAAIALMAGACGGSDSTASAPAETIEIEMRDTAYSPSSIDVPAGTKVTLRFRNTGTVTHDAFIGDKAEQEKHASESQSGDDGGHDHGGDDNALTLEPGETGTLVYTFDSDDDGTLIGCHEPGHYASGMKLTVNVTGG